MKKSTSAYIYKTSHFVLDSYYFKEEVKIMKKRLLILQDILI